MTTETTTLATRFLLVEFDRTMSMRLVTYHTNEKIKDPSEVNMNPNIDQKWIERFAKMFHKAPDTQKQLTDQEVYLGNNIVFSNMAEFKDHELLQPFVNGPAIKILMQDPPDEPSEIQQDVSSNFSVISLRFIPTPATVHFLFASLQSYRANF